MKLPQVLAQNYDILNISLLRVYVARDEGIEIPQPIKVVGELEWEVERIFHHRKKCNSSTLQYPVEYLGYDTSDTIWLDEHDLCNTPGVLKAYKDT